MWGWRTLLAVVLNLIVSLSWSLFFRSLYVYLSNIPILCWSKVALMWGWRTSLAVVLGAPIPARLSLCHLCHHHLRRDVKDRHCPHHHFCGRIPFGFINISMLGLCRPFEALCASICWLNIYRWMAQTWSILDQNWPNMAALSMFLSGPNGSKRDQNGLPKYFWPFGWGPFGGWMFFPPVVFAEFNFYFPKH